MEDWLQHITALHGLHALGFDDCDLPVGFWDVLGSFSQLTRLSMCKAEFSEWTRMFESDGESDSESTAVVPVPRIRLTPSVRHLVLINLRISQEKWGASTRRSPLLALAPSLSQARGGCKCRA
jgi:hypothetical protein